MPVGSPTTRCIAAACFCRRCRARPLSFTDTTVLAGTPYSYTVDAIDASPAHNKSAQSSPPATVTTPPSSGPAEPIIVIMMENKHYTDIVGNSNAPYIQSLIAKGTLYTNYQAGPGSLPDYLANTSGLTGSTSGSDNIFHQLQVKGVSWGEYEESMPSTCYTGGDTGSYKKGHNPAVYYNDITSNPTACANVLPYSSFSDQQSARLLLRRPQHGQRHARRRHSHRADPSRRRVAGRARARHAQRRRTKSS